MFQKFKLLLKKIFVGGNYNDLMDLSVDLDKEEEEQKKELQNNYKKIKKTKDFNKFHQLSIEFVLKRIEKTQYGKHSEFMHEIRYLMHYLFLVLHDDYLYGDNIFEKKLTEIDNYIFSAYRRQPKLAKNIKKLSMLAYSNRFTKKPKENILSYLVFLEENDIEIMEILYDYSLLLRKEDVSFNIFSNNNKFKKDYNKKKESQEKTCSFKTLYSIAPTLKETTRSAKFKIIRDDLNKSNT